MSVRSIITGIAMALPLLFLSCKRPSSDESFVKANQRDDWGRYCFNLAMDDPAYIYDVDVYLSVTENERAFEPFSEQALVEWISPQGAPFEEIIQFSSETEYQEFDFTRTYLYHYGIGLTPVDSGSWQLRLTFPEGFEQKVNLNGVGIRLIRNNGTR